ncbi:hypothetical protein D9757_004140 [Collybiopsis confluens]|uniref:F-box domain-containing protein n=1 Tax=Collybiopsis confluens TaxID=2823264 RepID=A0A8H5MD33_9AGAR|nr:hypothetical protein D9757_004140 [Collybiopsis confluens]
MSLPITQPPNPCITHPLPAPSHTETTLDTAVEEISAALTQIEVIISDVESDSAESVSNPPKATFTDLPSEILLIIFAHACKNSERWEALCLSLACSYWRALMLAEPPFWSNISLTVRDRDPYNTPPLSTSAQIRIAQLTLLYLKRSEDCLLSVSIKIPTRFRGLNTDIPWQLHISIAALNYLQKASKRIKHLYLRTDHSLLHDFAYLIPCSLEMDSRHSRPCSETIPLPRLTSLTVDYVSRNSCYLPFQNIPRLTHLSLGYEGLHFFQKSAGSQPQVIPDLKFPRLTTLTISNSLNFYQLCRSMTLTKTPSCPRQVILINMTSLADFLVSSPATAQAKFPDVSSLKISNSPNAFTAAFCRAFQLSGLKSFELEYNPDSLSDNAPGSNEPRNLSIPWTELACDIIYFIRRCPMIQIVTVRSAHECFYPRSELVQEISFGVGLRPELRIVGFPTHSDEHDAAGLLNASAMMEYLRSFEDRTVLDSDDP